MISKDKIVLFSNTCTTNCLLAYELIVEELNNKNFEVEHIGVLGDLWDSTGMAEQYEEMGFKSTLIPRISGNSTNTWFSENIHQEFAKSIDSISEYLKKLTSQYKSSKNIFILDDDTGYLEIVLISHFHKQKIPVLLMHHGYGFKYATEDYVKRRNFDLIPLLKNILLKIWNFGKLGSQLHIVKEHGFNEGYEICCSSQARESEMIKIGVNKKIWRTGYPFYDVIYKRLNSGQVIKKENKILIVSTGRGYFGDTQDAISFYRFIIDMAKSLGKKFHLVYRFKPSFEENIESFLPNDLVQEFEELNLEIDDNSVSGFVSVQKYKLVIGGGSTMLLEAVLQGTPAVFLDYEEKVESAINRGEKVSHIGYLLKRIIPLLSITKLENLRELIEYALLESYMDEINKSLKQNEELLFYKLDGRSAGRVAGVIRNKFK